LLYSALLFVIFLIFRLLATSSIKLNLNVNLKGKGKLGFDAI